MDNWWLYLIIGVILVGMILLTIIPQKKRQKQQQEMMNSLTVGTKIMTIGRLVGVIVQVNIVIDRNAVGLVLQNVAAPAAPAEPVVSEPAPAEENKAEETVFADEDTAVAEENAEATGAATEEEKKD